MTKLLPAIYEHGTLKLPGSFHLPEHQKVFVAIAIRQDEIPGMFISKLAEQSESFEFLKSPEEDIYSPEDGEEV